MLCGDISHSAMKRSASSSVSSQRPSASSGEQVCVGEANALPVAELLREVARCPDELLSANQLASESRQDAEIVKDDRREGRVDRRG